MNADSSDYENFNDASRSEPLKGPVDIAASSANPFREPLPQEAVDPFRVVSKRRSRASGFDYQGFRALCDNLYAEAQELQRVASHEDFGSSTDGFALELGALLDELYDFEAMPVKQKDILERIVVEVQSQLNNVDWDTRHISFIFDFAGFIRSRSHLVEDHLGIVIDMIKECGLDPYRGTLSGSDSIKKYNLTYASSRRREGIKA